MERYCGRTTYLAAGVKTLCGPRRYWNHDTSITGCRINAESKSRMVISSEWEISTFTTSRGVNSLCKTHHPCHIIHHLGDSTRHQYRWRKRLIHHEDAGFMVEIDAVLWLPPLQLIWFQIVKRRWDWWHFPSWMTFLPVIRTVMKSLRDYWSAVYPSIILTVQTRMTITMPEVRRTFAKHLVSKCQFIVRPWQAKLSKLFWYLPFRQERFDLTVEQDLSKNCLLGIKLKIHQFRRDGETEATIKKNRSREVGRDWCYNYRRCKTARLYYGFNYIMA